MFAGAPAQELHKLKPSYAEVWALEEPLSRTAGMLVFSLYGFSPSGFRCVKTFLAAPAFRKVFAAFSSSFTTFGLAVLTVAPPPPPPPTAAATTRNY